MNTDYLDCRNGACRLSPKEFHVEKVFRFEGPTDPADEAILYAISSHNGDIKGLLVNGYGMYADGLTNDMVEKLLAR
jgi:hypothetical protein